MTAIVEPPPFVHGGSLFHRLPFDRTAHALARMGVLVNASNPRAHAVHVERDVSYGHPDEPPHPDRRLDVYVPRSHGPMPVILYAHGGGFCVCSKDTHRIFALFLARAGFLVFNINYRQGPANPHPAPLEDAARALHWVHAHLREYGGDPSRVALGGESAGANLVTALAIAHAYPRPEPACRGIFEARYPLSAVVATYGLLDMRASNELLRHPRLARWIKALVHDAVSAYVGPDVEAFTAANPLSSPLLVLEGGEPPARPLPPFFVSVGTRDPLFDQSRRLARALDRLGARTELLVHPGETHAYDAWFWRASCREKWSSANAFLRAAFWSEARVAREAAG